ncbi:hypothetical protein BUALT_Bualt13G0079300 [Buddleja alternifolia]|uniref:Retrotransposon gag domain-containing protein n=1 Tax=Buddleja alternifolia TaxID=168488 RepID=A0AAV6WUQ9_9LAMI|nr:hypothetical protein BUALT_Bualt13G0079300 [Buddleja alternifolia]
MADSTRSKEIAENLKKQEILLMEERAEGLAAHQHINNQLERMITIQGGLQSSMVAIENFQKGMQQQLQLMNEKMQQQIRGKSILGEGPSAPMERRSNLSQTRNNTHSTSENHGSNYTPFPKIVFPHFDGENPRSWILRSNRYFQVITTIPKEQKVTSASVYLEGKAELWFQGCMEGKELPSWQQFTIAVLECFDDNDPDLIVGNFNKLHQTCSVADYLERFEEMKSHMLIFNKDLPEEFFSANFLSGLKEEIRGVVMALKPNDFHQAVSLAKRQESTVNAIIKRANIGSTHCFLDESTAHKLGCKLDYTTPMIVNVADGSKMVSSQQSDSSSVPCFPFEEEDRSPSLRHHPIPAIDNEGQIQVYPLAALSRRIVPRNDTVATQVLVHWVNSSPEQATWEDLTSLCSRFPTFDYWGQRSSHVAFLQLKQERPRSQLLEGNPMAPALQIQEPFVGGAIYYITMAAADSFGEVSHYEAQVREKLNTRARKEVKYAYPQLPFNLKRIIDDEKNGGRRVVIWFKSCEESEEFTENYQ